MATTFGSAHGEERKCASCGLTYRYQQAKTFVCISCFRQQPWDGWVGQNTRSGSGDAQQIDTQGKTLSDALKDEPAQMYPGDAVSAIDLHAVHATLNQMSADGLRQLHDRLAILQMVAVANEADDPEYYARVRQALAGAGVRF